ncbi:hypothetical protein P9X10_01415 [Bacillus cereus]|nr:hypothetical protein [Bacillus cereus]
MKDKNGVLITEGVTIQFDDDYLGHGFTREVKRDKDGILGFQAIPNVSEDLCYIEVWLEDIEVVTENTVMRTMAKHVTLDGKPYFV